MRLERRVVSRRQALGALAGGALLPWLHSNARAQSTAPPKRLVLLYNPNGTITDAFWPSEVSSERQFELGPILEPLAPLKDRLLLLRGLDLTVTDRNFGPGGPHQRGVGALFTGRELQEGTMVGGDGSLAGWANGASVDQALVQALNPPTLLPSLELGVRATASDVRSRLIYSAPGSPVPPQNDPSEVFQRLSSGFGRLSGGGDADKREQRRLVLQALQSQYRSLSRRVSASDREKLERHTDFLQGITRRLDFSIDASGACQLPAAPPVLEPDNETVMPDITKLQLDLLVLALACDTTRFASLQFSSAINAIRFPWLGSLHEGHALSHRGPSDTEARQQLVDRSRWYAEQVAYLASKLAAIPEGEGSLLDNTLLVWGNELSVGNTHDLRDIPFVTIGNLDGQLNTGRYVQFGGQPHNRLLVSISNLMGDARQSFGNPEVSAAGGLPGLTV